MLKRFVEIQLEICSIYEAQCTKENSLLKFTELRDLLTEEFCKMLIA